MQCPNCGSQIPENSAFCTQCGTAQRQYQQPSYQQPVYQPPVTPAAKPRAEKKENVGMGIVGAILGAIVGGASIILLSQLGLISAMSGLLLAVGTMYGYEKLGGKISVTGVIICIVLMLVTPYLADRLDWAILIVKELSGYTLLEAFQDVHYLAESDAYMGNLLKIYGFTALGAIGTIINAFKK